MPENCKKALLIIDIQKFFLDGRFRGKVENHKKLKENIKDAINLFKTKNVLIIATKHYNVIGANDPFFRFYGRILEKKSQKSRLLNFITKDKYIKIFKKRTYSPFYNKKFLSFLQKNKIKTLYLTGVLLEKCVLITAFDAFQRNYDVFIIKDCVGARDIKNMDLFLNLIKKSCGHVISLGELKECLS